LLFFVAEYVFNYLLAAAMFDALYISEDLTCSFFALNTRGHPGEPSDALHIRQSSELID